MILITLLVCMAVQRLLDVGALLRNIHWFKTYTGWFKSFQGKAGVWADIAIVLLPMLLVVALLDAFLGRWFLGVPDFLFAVFVLLCCMDARDLRVVLKDYFAASEKKDVAAAGKAAKAFVEGPVPATANELSRAVTRGIFIQSLGRIFAVFFWFAILGPFGAALYYMTAQLCESGMQKGASHKAAQQVLGILEWVPVRLAGFSYALVGSFGGGFGYMVKQLVSGINHNKDVAADSGFAALSINKKGAADASEKENRQALSLIDRALIVWLVVAAIFTIGVWMP